MNEDGDPIFVSDDEENEDGAYLSSQGEKKRLGDISHPEEGEE